MQNHPTARDKEEAVFRFCAAVAQGHAAPVTAQEANLLLVAASLLGGRPAAARLRFEGDRFFSTLELEPMSLQEVVRQGLVRDLPRFRDGVEAALSEGASAS